MRAVLVAALALVGCSLARRTPDIRYYTLAVPGAPSTSSVTMTVGRFTADEPYATPRLAYRTSPYRIDYYVFHRWAGDPRWIVASAARDYLDRAAPAPGWASYELTGNVRRLEEVDDATGCQAALALDLRIEHDGRAVLTRSYAETEPAEPGRPEMVAAALSRALGRILDRALVDLRSVPRAGEDPSAHRCGSVQLHRQARGRPNLCTAERTWRRMRFCANSTSSAAS